MARSPSLDQSISTALAAHRKGDLRKAAKIYDKVLKQAPNHAMALNLSGVLAYQKGDLKRAEVRLAKALTLEPGNMEFNANMGEVLRAAREFDRARAHLERCLQANPRYGAALNNMGSTFASEGRWAEAASWFEKALAVDPGMVNALFNLGVCRLETGAHEQALPLLSRAAEAAPGNLDVQARLGDALYLSRRFEDAETCYRQALTDPKALTTTDATEVLNNLTGALIALRRGEEVTRAYRDAVAAFPRSARLQAALALWFEKSGRAEEARASAEKALDIDRDDARAALTLSRLDLRESRPEAAIARLEKLIERRPDDLWTPTALMELGLALDRVGDADGAFARWSEGNRRLAATPKWRRVDGGAFIARARRIGAWLEKGPDLAFPEVAIPGDPEDPVFMVGFPRSGTTLLERVIASLDGFVVSDEQPFLPDLLHKAAEITGKPFLFPENLADLDDERVRALRAAYWTAVEGAMGPEVRGSRLLDKLPLNLTDLGLVRRLFPRARVIMVLRDPRDSCLSNFMQNYEPNAAMAPFLDLDTTAESYGAVMALWPLYRERLGLAWLESRYEDLVADFDGTTRRLLAFLDVPWTEEIRNFQKKKNPEWISTPSYRDVQAPIYRRAQGRWRTYEKELAGILPSLQPFVEAFGYAGD